MLIYRSLIGLLTLLLVSILVFAATQTLPGNAASAVLLNTATPQRLHALEVQLGLNKPAVQQYWTWLTGILHGNFGTSLANGTSVGTLVGGRILNSLVLVILAGAIGTLIGVGLGVIAAYAGGWWDSVIMRAVDVILAFPQLVFALLLVSILGPKIWLIVLAVAISHAPQVARVTRAAALDISERDFVKAMQILGIPGRRIIRRDVLPNLTSVLMVEIGLRLTYSMLVIAGLSFLGFGLQPPAASWGLMINENRVGLIANPWGVLMPAILIALFTIGVNTFTDAVARASLGVGRRSTEPDPLVDLAVEGATI